MVKTQIVRSKIFNAVISAEVTKGHLKWKVSDIARVTGVSRPLIYYHFGKTKNEILIECLNVIAIEYYGLTPEREQLMTGGEIFESLMKTRQMFLKNPSLVVFYQKWRLQDSPLGKQLIELEKRYHAKLRSVFPQLSDLQVIALHAIFHGLATAPFLTPQSLAQALEMLTAFFAKAKSPKPDR